MDLCAIRATFEIARKRVSDYALWMRYILLTDIVFYAINVHIRSCLIWWCEGWDEGVGKKGWGGAKEEGCCVSAVCPESFAPPKWFQVCVVSDQLPQISGGDAGTLVHTHRKTHTETEAGEEDRGGRISGWRRGAKENTSQKKQTRFPRRATQRSVGGQQRTGACPRPWIHSFIHQVSSF